MANDTSTVLDSDVLYLDYNATTPLDPEVRKAIKRSIDDDWANPSSGKYSFENLIFNGMIFYALVKSQ